jgi:hypothetical protein
MIREPIVASTALSLSHRYGFVLHNLFSYSSQFCELLLARLQGPLASILLRLAMMQVGQRGKFAKIQIL